MTCRKHRWKQIFDSKYFVRLKTYTPVFWQNHQTLSIIRRQLKYIQMLTRDRGSRGRYKGALLHLSHSSFHYHFSNFTSLSYPWMKAITLHPEYSFLVEWKSFIHIQYKIWMSKWGNQSMWGCVIKEYSLDGQNKLLSELHFHISIFTECSFTFFNPPRILFLLQSYLRLPLNLAIVQQQLSRKVEQHLVPNVQQRHTNQN